MIIDKLSKGCFFACAIVSIIAILCITLYLILASVPAIAKVGIFNFIFGGVWRPTSDLPNSEKFGIFPMIVGSIYVTAGAIVIGVFFGVMSAVFIARFCPKKLRAVIKQTINLLAGLPSVIYGFFGMIVIIPAFKKLAIAIGIGNRVTGSGILACSIILGIMILPTIISLTQNALESQPENYFEGALALGATKEQAVFKVLLPASKSGILAGIVLGVGRALGETMAVVLVCGGAPVLPESIFHPMRTLTANIVMEMGYSSGLHREMLIATGLVLFVFIMLLTLSINLLRKDRGGSKKTKKVKEKVEIKEEQGE